MIHKMMVSAPLDSLGGYMLYAFPHIVADYVGY